MSWSTSSESQSNFEKGGLMSNDKLLTLPQAAEYLGIKDHVLHNAFYRSNKTEPDPTYIRRRLYFNTSVLDKIKKEGIAFREKS